MKSFLYLVQSEGELPPSYDLASTDSDVLALTWKTPVAGALHLPKSTWTEGRNRLLSQALLGSAYEYYIFLDDDIHFQSGGWREFEASLRSHTPAVAVPLFPPYHPRHPAGPGRAYGFDAMCNAFSRAVVEDEILLPYCGLYDESTWWSSQLILIHLANAVYGPPLVCTEVVIENQKHGRYGATGTSIFPEVERWLKGDVLPAELHDRLISYDRADFFLCSPWPSAPIEGSSPDKGLIRSRLAARR